jgi:hypothetical protein
MEEKFSVSLELMIQKFKDGAKKAQEVSQNVSNKIKENMSVDIGSNAFKGMNAESELLLNKINDIKATLQMANDTPKLLPKQDILEMRVELEKLEGQYNKINQSSNMFSSFFNKIQDGINKSLKSAKRFTLSLFGIHSIYRMLSRASSSYLAQDTETSSKIQSAWIGLGSIFAPLLQTVANFTIKAVSYINVFIKALTGTDFLANAMAKSMNKAGKSAGKLSKILAGFDELTNLDDSAGGASVDTSWIDSFKNVELDPTLVKKITEFGKTIKNVWDKYFAPFFKLLKDNWDLVGKDVVGLGLLIGIVVDAFTGNWIGLIIKLVGFIALYWDDIKAIFKLGIDVIWEIIKSLWEMIKGLFDLAISIIKSAMSVIVGIITVPIELIKGVFWSIVDSVKGVINGVKNIFNGLITFITGVFTGNWKKAWEGVTQIFKGIVDTLWSIIKFPLNLIIDGINALIGGLNKIKFDVPNWVPFIGGKKWGFSIPKIPKLEVGTPNVEKSGYAVIHEGEAVVPKRFNSDEYFSRLGGSNNEQTNALLEQLIDRVERIEINPYTTIKDVGYASQKYRSQKSRIMGEELI